MRIRKKTRMTRDAIVASEFPHADAVTAGGIWQPNTDKECRTFLAEASKSKKRKVTAASSKEDIQEALEKFMGTFNGEPEKK